MTTAKTPQSRAELLRALHETLRKVGVQSVLLSDTVAKLVGLNSTDLECLDLLELGGPTTAGELSRHSGLTTGATTVVIDRLERAGLVRRARNMEDRRSVLVETRPHCLRHIEPLYRKLAVATDRLNEHYGDRELAIVVEYLSRVVELCAEHVTWLQTQPSVRGLSTRERGSTHARKRPTGSERTSHRTARAAARRS